jgi:hypothetical protein
MITPQHTCTLAMLVGILALGMHPPAEAQSARADSTTSHIEGMAPALAGAADIATTKAFDTALQDYERCTGCPPSSNWFAWPIEATRNPRAW